MEKRVAYNLLQTPCKPDTIQTGEHGFSTRNLQDLERELAEIERKLLPLLNAIRTMRGEKPVFVPKG